MRRTRPAISLLAAVLLSLALLLGVSPTAGAVTYTPRLCVGFTACSNAGKGNAGYSSVYTTSHWGQYRNHNCTNYVAYRMIKAGVPQFITPGAGNATTWGAQARSKGIAVNKTNPAPGDVAWWDNTKMGSAGHVAYVESVNISAGTFTVSQDSWQGDFSWRTYYISEVSGFLHVGNKLPVGAINSTTGGIGQVKVRGWALDQDTPNAAIKVRVYIGGPSSTGEKHELTANLRRTDIADRYPGTGQNHGFEATLTTSKRGSQTVYVYLVNAPTGTNPLISQRTVTITDPDPMGTTETFAAPPTQVRVKGWSADPNEPNAKLDIKVYVGGDKGTSGAHEFKGTTGVTRDDVKRANSWVGQQSGFDLTFATTKRGRQRVYAYAANKGAGKDSLLGWTTVTITDPIAFQKAAVSVTGTAQVGQTLTAKGEFTDNPSYKYQWYRSGTAISGATKSTYPMGPSDLNKAITVKITGTKVGYKTTTVTSRATSPVKLGSFTIGTTARLTGQTKVGYPQHVSVASWSGGGRSMTVTWYRDGVQFATGTATSSRKLTTAEVGKRITAKVTYKRTGYTDVVKTSAPSAKVTAR